MMKNRNVKVNVNISENALEQFDAGLISFQELKQRLEVTITMNEDYLHFDQFIKLLSS
tara:strand:- start:441 stop:614 length:174 start_codon:yes stop_codon:yes gene_type:complete